MVTDEQITLYALGALDAREAAEFERQLASSPELRARVAEEKAAAAALLASVETVSPPPELKRKVMARISNAAPPTRATQHESHDARSPSAGWGDVWRWIFGGLAAGFAALAAVFGIGMLNTQSQIAQLQSRVAQLQATAETAPAIQAQLQEATARAAQLERELAEARANLEGARAAIGTAESNAASAQSEAAAAQTRADELASQLASVQRELAVLNQTDIRTASLPSRQPDFQSGAINVFYSPDGKTALLTVHNLPPLTPDLTYQVWLIKGNQPLPSSVFNTSPDGTGRLIVESDEPFSAFGNLGITIEPAGGRPTPNPEGPIFLGPLMQG